VPPGDLHERRGDVRAFARVKRSLRRGRSAGASVEPALFGPTAEDFVARVLAVEARRALARRLAGAGDPEATAETQRALDLARPLAGRGVPAWDAVVSATEREARAFPVR
jgi:hypothetical protein